MAERMPVEGPDGLPDQGPRCDHCGVRVPVFAELGVDAEREVRDLIAGGDPARAMLALRRAAGCSITWAKVWVQHEGRPRPRDPGTTCRYCGGRLCTAQAKQCLECGMDWHDAANPRRLGG
jgi:hypothetical protein